MDKLRKTGVDHHVKIKVVGVSTVRYYEWTKKKCGGKKNYPLE